MSSTSDGVQDEEEDFNNLDCLFENSGIKKRATKKEIDDLLTYIGGFEKWNNLNDDCRIQVLKLLEYEDRGRLGFCSKRDNLLVESTPLHVDTIQVEEGTLVVMESQIVRFYGFADFTDEQFLKTKAQLITFSPMSEEIEPTIKLGELGDALNEIEKLSSKGRIRLLNSFISGFEKWDQLNEDCRLHVVQFLDYKSMCNLERCSKQDQKSVKDAPIQIFSVEIAELDDGSAENGQKVPDSVRVTLRFSFTAKNYELIFSQNGEYVERVCGVKRRREIIIVKSSDHYQEAVNFAERMIRKGQNRLEELRVYMKKYPFENSQMRSLPRCKTARLGVMNKVEMWWWLKWLPKDNLDVWISTFERDTFKLALSSEDLNCQQNWINGTGCRLQRMHLGFMEDRKLDVILQGIEFREWDQDFKDEVSIKNVHFVMEFESICGIGELYQIYSKVDPYESITLQISDVYTGLLCLYHTGKRATSFDGEIYTSFTAPDYLYH
ncbi:Protein CBG06923 [Caenorhabditis briggsae]|uniref:Protein CBG06923 n=1 Tax=Caenorhabditis briggsae TaxID=6238 RepID=A8X3D4_CAEBR|nr:Protein CBG06923 [Caenorhabditis briggsae]CAP27144.1 Protein CBG06923 [Caenorhabditis briggsae]